MHLFAHSLIHSLNSMHSFIHSFINSFLRSFLPSVFQSFVLSVFQSFILSFFPFFPSFIFFNFSFFHSFVPCFARQHRAEIVGLYVSRRIGTSFDLPYHLRQAAKVHHASKWILENRMVPVSQRFCSFNAVVLSVACLLVGVVPETHTVQALDLHFRKVCRCIVSPSPRASTAPSTSFLELSAAAVLCGGAFAPPMAEILADARWS